MHRLKDESAYRQHRAWHRTLRNMKTALYLTRHLPKKESNEPHITLTYRMHSEEQCQYTQRYLPHRVEIHL